MTFNYCVQYTYVGSDPELKGKWMLVESGINGMTFQHYRDEMRRQTWSYKQAMMNLVKA